MARSTPTLASAAVLALSVLGASTARAAETRVVAWGDSIAYGYYDGTNTSNECHELAGATSTNPPETCGITGRLMNRLNSSSTLANVPPNDSTIYDIGALNLGLGGESTGSALTRMDRAAWTCPCTTKSPACPINSLKYWYCNGTLQPNDLLVLLEGTNDVTNEVSVETIRANLDALGGKAEALGLDVVILSVVERHPDACVDDQNVVVQQLNDEIESLALGSGWPFVNVFLRMSFFANLYTNHYQGWDPMKCAVPAPTCPCDPVGHPKASGFDKMTWEAAAENYPLTIEYAVRGALPPRLTLTPPGSPRTQGYSLPFSVALSDLATFGQTVELTWSFGDGDTLAESVSSSPVARSHAYSSSGPFTATVTARHANGGDRAVSSTFSVTASASTIFVDGFDVGNSSAWE